MKRRGSVELETGSSDLTSEIETLLHEGASPQSTNDSILLSSDALTDDSVLLSSDALTEKSATKVSPFASDGVPAYWSRGASRHAVLTLVELKRGDREFDKIYRDMVASGIHVLKIERLQNTRLLERFKGEIKDFEHRHTRGSDANICYLYHGTNADKERLCEEGLDQRLSRLGHFGKGIYFSDNPAKCLQYTRTESETISASYILRCRVILGDTKVYPDGTYDTSLRREPEKEHYVRGWRYYDSVMGRPKDHKEYVVYESRRAMIEYIITFVAPDQTTLDEMLSPTHADEMLPDFLVESHREVNSPVTTTSRRRSSFEDDPYIPQHREVNSPIRQISRRLSLVDHDPEITSHGAQNALEFESEVQTDQDLLRMIENLHYHESQPAQEETEGNVTGEDLERTAPVSFPDSDTTPAQGISEFMQVTGVSDSISARQYLQRADWDVNLAIAYFYEDL